MGGSETVIVDGGVLGLNTSGDHAPTNETNDPGEVYGKKVVVLNKIVGIEL